MATKNEVQLRNEQVYEMLMPGSGMEKQAVDKLNEFTRTRLREDGFMDMILPPMTVSNDELDMQIGTDKPMKIFEKEPDAPAAISVPFATLPTNVYIQAPKYPVMFNRILTPRFIKDVDELRTYRMDVRQILADNALKDLLAERDTKFIRATNATLIAADAPLPWSGVPQWETIDGGVTRDTLCDAAKVMPRAFSRLEAKTYLVNNIFVKELQKFGRDEMGGDMSQDVLANGWSKADFMKATWVVTIKRELVPDDTIFMYADPKFLGKNCMLEDTVLYIKRDFFLIEWFLYQTSGCTFGHSGGLARVDYA